MKTKQNKKVQKLKDPQSFTAGSRLKVFHLYVQKQSIHGYWLLTGNLVLKGPIQQLFFFFFFYLKETSLTRRFIKKQDVSTENITYSGLFCNPNKAELFQESTNWSSVTSKNGMENGKPSVSSEHKKKTITIM